MPRIAVTGSPGTGKTTLCAEARRRHGWRVVDVGAWARQEGCVAGRDDADDADVVDVEALASRVPADDGTVVLYDGHLSHLLGLDAAWVVRCDPRRLRERLLARGYAPAKVAENVEAEAMDLILQEALDATDHVLQRDGTHRDATALLDAFAPGGTVNLKRHDLERVDWSDALMGETHGP